MAQAQMMQGLLDVTAALARHDQMLRGLHNSELFVAPLRGQEAVVSSRMEGTISTLDEVLLLEAEFGHGDNERASRELRSDAVETALYRRAMNTAQAMMQEGRPLSGCSKACTGSCFPLGAGPANRPEPTNTSRTTWANAEAAR